MTETTLPPASRYQDGSEKTITIDGVNVTYRVMGGEWVKVSETDIRTIVVPAGTSFKIVDDADSPTFVFGVSNSDITPGVKNFGLYLTDLSMQVQTAYTPATQETIHTVYATNDNGAVSHVVQLAADGTSTLACNADIVEFSGIPTYADNAAAVAGGLAVGKDYNTPTGERRVVV